MPKASFCPCPCFPLRALESRILVRLHPLSLCDERALSPFLFAHVVCCLGVLVCELHAWLSVRSSNWLRIRCMTCLESHPSFHPSLYSSSSLHLFCSSPSVSSPLPNLRYLCQSLQDRYPDPP
ncbi:hypothetical protein BJX62DRAFT_193880 [Aspergillus germanicus]